MYNLGLAICETDGQDQSNEQEWLTNIEFINPVAPFTNMENFSPTMDK